MSAAAERAADYAFWQLIASGVGIPLIVASLIFAGIGAFAARDAAIAARDQARLTEQTAERQLRAYINVEADGIHIWELGYLAHARVIALNVGQTPAYGVNVIANLQVLSEPPEKDITGDAKVVIAGDMFIAPGHRRIVGFDVPIRDADIEHVIVDNKWAVLAGYIKYRDAFGVDRETRFCHLYKGKDRLSAGYVRYHHLGNSAT